MTDTLRLETSRLLLRPLVADDFEPFYEGLVCDPVVMAFYHAYALPMADAERRARARRDFFDHFADGAERFGYICWTITSKPTVAASGVPPAMTGGTGQLLGWAAIVTPALKDAALGPELAYMIASPFHGRGLATEAAGAVIADAFPRYGLAALHAVMDTPNTASRKVAEKLGFAYRGPVSVYGSDDMVLFSLARNAASTQRTNGRGE